MMTVIVEDPEENNADEEVHDPLLSGLGLSGCESPWPLETVEEVHDSAFARLGLDGCESPWPLETVAEVNHRQPPNGTHASVSLWSMDRVGEAKQRLAEYSADVEGQVESAASSGS